MIISARILYNIMFTGNFFTLGFQLQNFKCKFLLLMRSGGLMVSVLDSGSRGPGSSPGQGTALCSWVRHFINIVPLFTQVLIKWVSANLMLVVSL